MKKISIIFVLGFLALSFNSFSQIKVNSTGKVGINQNYPEYNLDWLGTGRFWSNWGQLLFDNNGNGGVATIHPDSDWLGCLGTSDKKFNTIYTYTLYYDNIVDWSDEKLKENVKPLENSLSKIKLLKGVSYNMKKEFYNVKDPALLTNIMDNNKKDMGFLAQEVKEVLPDLVILDTTSNLYSVNYVKLIPVLVEAMKEQQNIIEDLAAKIESIEADCCDQNLKSASLSGSEDIESNLETAILYQNNPNPFKNKTEIKCYIPEGCISSMLHIFNMQGTQLEQVSISGIGNKSVRVDGNKYKPGMYLYSLVIDGREIDTKRMILTK